MICDSNEWKIESTALISSGWKCKSYGHRSGDKECPNFYSGKKNNEEFRYVSLDHMFCRSAALPELRGRSRMPRPTFSQTFPTCCMTILLERIVPCISFLTPLDRLGVFAMQIRLIDYRVIIAIFRVLSFTVFRAELKAKLKPEIE